MTKRTEAGLCAAFIEALEPGWTVYPETAGWDMLLVLEERREYTAMEKRVRLRCGQDYPLESGTQVGIEAKLRGNFKVLSQALPSIAWCDVEEQAGPDFRAVLIPKGSSEFKEIAAALSLVVIEMEPKGDYPPPFADRLESVLRHRTCWQHSRHHKLPEIVPDTPCGVPSPRTMSRWKIGAVRLCMRLRERGFLQRADFNEFGISTTAWYHRWLVKGEKFGRVQQWVAKPGWVPWDEQEPGVAEQLRAKDV